MQSLQAAESNLEEAQAALAEARQRGDSDLTRLGGEYDSVKQSLEDLEVNPLMRCISAHLSFLQCSTVCSC